MAALRGTGPGVAVPVPPDDKTNQRRQEAARKFMQFYYRERPRPREELLRFLMDENNNWWDMAKGTPFYQVYPKEDIEAIAKALCGRRAMEVACGDGYLSYWLGQMGIDITAVDDYSSFGTRLAAPIDVHRMDFRSALRRFKPEAVICSWMPQEQNWSEDFVLSPSVERYIIISEEAGTVTGTPESVMTYPGWASERVPGFIGLCRTDYAIPEGGVMVVTRHTVALSFVREDSLKEPCRS